MAGQYGAYLAQGYMMTPAIAALLTRLFFYPPKFSDANLRFGRLKDYLKFWLISLGITGVSYISFTVLGGITWDFSGRVFLDKLAQQFAVTGQDIQAALPPGFTPSMMLLIYTIGGLTVFNVIPGIITGFGEEFGHRGFMFPMLYKIKPWIGIIIGGLLWYLWHIPLAFVIPQATKLPFWQTTLNLLILALGSICTHTYLAYVYAKSESIFVTALAHITMNNTAASFSYYAVIQNQVACNLGLTLTMLLTIAILYFRKELRVFAKYFCATKTG
ncbi:MAG: CPBP family intramembrane glutamic endopeptidase [Anaerolineales bacterium]